MTNDINDIHGNADFEDRPPVSGKPQDDLLKDRYVAQTVRWLNDNGYSVIPTAEASTGAAPDVLDLVLLEAAHYNVFQGKLAHANLRMVVDAARNSAARLAEQEREEGR